MDSLRAITLSAVGMENGEIIDFIPREHDENVFLEQKEIWRMDNNVEIGYLLLPFSQIEKVLENGLSCPFEENWKGVSVGLNGELNFPYGNGIYCCKNVPNFFDREKYFVAVAAILPGVDCRFLNEEEASVFEFTGLPCDSLLVSGETWVLRSASQILPLFAFW